jgi:hypothetical protein
MKGGSFYQSAPFNETIRNNLSSADELLEKQIKK